jgi:hypothetical protein
LKQSQDNWTLQEIIQYTDKRYEAWALLLQQDPTNHELTEIIISTGLRQEASELLKERLRATPVNEDELIKTIATAIVNQPELLKTHRCRCHIERSCCLAGWATTFSPVAKEIEQNNTTKIAFCAVLPNYAYLFNYDDKTVMEKLQEIVAK